MLMIGSYGETKTFNVFNNETAYQYYRLNIFGLSIRKLDVLVYKNGDFIPIVHLVHFFRKRIKKQLGIPSNLHRVG